MSKLLDEARKELDKSYEEYISGRSSDMSYEYGNVLAWKQAVKMIEEHENLKISDELNEILLDIRESLGNVLDHLGDLESKEDEIKAVFADIQKAIDMTEPIKLTEDEEEVYKKLIMEYQDYLKCFPERDNNIFYAVRDVYEDWGKWDKDKTFLPALRKFLNEVAE